MFPDPKSSESGLPYYSDGTRDDLMQRRYLEAVLGALDPDFGAAALNPTSTVYGGRMIAPDGVHLWTWDARPWPVFPAADGVWSDAGNWETGHWLTGRFGGAPLDALVAAILTDGGMAGADTSALGEGPQGYVVDRPMAPRAALDPLALAYAFDAFEVEGRLRFAAQPVTLGGVHQSIGQTKGGQRFTRQLKGLLTPPSCLLRIAQQPQDHRQPRETRDA